MRMITLLLYVAIFVGIPLYTLVALVMPQIGQLQYTYAHADEIAARAAGVPTSDGK